MYLRFGKYLRLWKLKALGEEEISNLIRFAKLASSRIVGPFLARKLVIVVALFLK